MKYSADVTPASEIEGGGGCRECLGMFDVLKMCNDYDYNILIHVNTSDYGPARAGPLYEIRI